MLMAATFALPGMRRPPLGNGHESLQEPNAQEPIPKNQFPDVLGFGIWFLVLELGFYFVSSMVGPLALSVKQG
jgi:hypothetical protein